MPEMDIMHHTTPHRTIIWLAVPYSKFKFGLMTIDIKAKHVPDRKRATSRGQMASVSMWFENVYHLVVWESLLLRLEVLGFDVDKIKEIATEAGWSLEELS